MQVKVLGSYSLPEHGPHRRASVRPETDRQAGFDAQHDHSTLVYDTFLSGSGAQIVVVSPALNNLLVPFAEARFSIGSAPVTPLIRPLDRCVRTVLPCSGEAGVVTIDGALGKIQLVPQRNHWALFRGKRVILTKSKDNDLAWIRYWVEFNVRVHGANAVLLYDNASTKYTAEEVDGVVSSVAGVEQAVVVSWPFAYGAPAGPQGVWDSDYSQYGLLEDARWRFLGAASGVLSTDVDELVVVAPEARLFDVLDRLPTGYLRFDGIWVSTVRDRERLGGAACHDDFRYVDVLALPCELKWAVVPGLCPAGWQWRIHDVTGMVPSRPEGIAIGMRHFRGISTNWKGYRTAPEVLDLGRHRRDEALAAAMARAAM